MMDKYKLWENIPENLRTKTQLRGMGLKPADGQPVAAWKVGGKGPFDLFDVALAEPITKKPATEAQLAALKKARAAQCCKGCGERFNRQPRSRNYRDGYCWYCWQKQAAIAWARATLAAGNGIILDTETTGLDDKAQIVEISIINLAGETLLNTLVRPIGSIPEEASNIHGIYDIDVIDAQPWPEVWPGVEKFLKEAGQIIIYNAAFDWRIIKQALIANNLPLPDYDLPIHCAMKTYAEYVNVWSVCNKSFRWHKLEGGHRALDDCLACLDLIKIMAGSKGENDGNQSLS